MKTLNYNDFLLELQDIYSILSTADTAKNAAIPEMAPMKRRMAYYPFSY